MGPGGGSFGGSAYGGFGFGGAGGAAPANVQMGAGPRNVSMGARPGTIQPQQMPGREAGIGAADRVAAIQGPNRDAANAAIFAQAKDKVGATSRGALTGLAGAMAGRGISGSGVEARGQQETVQAGQQQLGDVARQQAVTDADIAEQNALATYQGDIAQRGQNLGFDTTQRGQNVEQRGQDIGALEAAQNSLVAQRGQDLAQQGLEYQGGIAQRGQDIGRLGEQFQGGIAQRGQDIQRQGEQGRLGLGYADLSLRARQQAMSGLQGAGGMGYGGRGAY